MSKKSRVYKRGGKCFRYDYDNALVIWVMKATQEDINDNKEWQEKHGRNLHDIDDDGYIEVDAVGLSSSNWKNKEMRDSYLDQWIDEINEEATYLMNEFIKFG